MALPKAAIWKLEPHTKAKHEILRRYLQAWFPIINKFNDRLIYIDGFCGPGRYDGGEPGSPIIALDVAATHRVEISGEVVFAFIDEREDRINNLRTELDGIETKSNFRIHTEFGKFDEKIKRIFETLEEQNAHLAPTFAFVDPFGFSGIPFVTISQILKENRCEALITFMVDSINRFLAHPDEKIVRHIVDAFGTDEAIEIANSDVDRIAALRELYQRQLQSVAKYVRYFEMRDHRDRIQYYLFFATNSDIGHVRMKEAMWKVDPDGEFKFSDATNPRDLVLFEADPTPPLMRRICKKFRKEENVTGENIRKFVENKTAYLKKHMTIVLKDLEANREIEVNSIKTDGKKRRRNTYPDSALISFT